MRKWHQEASGVGVGMVGGPPILVPVNFEIAHDESICTDCLAAMRLTFNTSEKLVGPTAPPQSVADRLLCVGPQHRCLTKVPLSDNILDYLHIY
jgi:hypothetical protein